MHIFNEYSELSSKSEKHFCTIF